MNEKQTQKKTNNSAEIEHEYTTFKSIKNETIANKDN